MSNLIFQKPWNMTESEATPESVYMNRRDFIKGTSLVTLATAATLYGCGIGPTPDPNAPVEWSATEEKIYPVKRNTEYSIDRNITEEKVAASFNNFYEFSEIKSDPRFHAQALSTRPWEIEVTGLVSKPR
ncbi:uncharacterized protein METZ01_LOCUS200295, partial [marine metagenome]